MIDHDKSYWPKCGTKVQGKFSDYDLDDLWNECEDQASVFVARALIANEPDCCIDDDGGLIVFLWSVGDDCLTLKFDLKTEVENFSTVYDKVRSEEQKSDVLSRIAKLDDLANAIRKAQSHMKSLVDTYDATVMEGN